jgi:hypothetical protein
VSIPDEVVVGGVDGKLVMFLTERFTAVVRSGLADGERASRGCLQRALGAMERKWRWDERHDFGWWTFQAQAATVEGSPCQDHVIATDLTRPGGLPNVVAGEADHGGC